MAVLKLVPAAINITARRNVASNSRSGVIKDMTGAVIDLSTWSAFTCTLVPSVAGPASGSISRGTCTGNADGTIDVLFDATDLSDDTPGTCNVVITGVHVALDDPQIMAQGTFTLLAQ